MKKLTLVSAVLAALLLASTAYAGPPVPEMLDSINIGAGDGLDGGMEWGPVEPDYSGGSYGGIGAGGCRVVYGPPAVDTTRYAYVTLDTQGKGFARHIKLRVLDGIADDSFNIYAQNPGGDWALVYHYDSDPSTTEYWVTHHIYSFPAGKGQGADVYIKIEATGAQWSGFNQYGQLAVDWIEVWGF